MVVWITGLSGAGKSTLAKKLVSELKNQRDNVLLLDGDAVRAAINDTQTGYDRESRIRNAYRICRLAKTFEEQGMLVVVATMSLYSEIHLWNRENYEDYLEVYIDVSLEELKARGVRDFYNENADEKNVVGLDAQYDVPKKPDVTLNNTKDEQTFLRNTAKIQELLQKRGTL